MNDWLRFSFAFPWVLWFLIVPFAIVLDRLWGRKTHIYLPLDLGSNLSKKVLGWLTSGAEFISPLILALVVLLLAGPVRYVRPKAERQLTNIDIVLDVSGSMSSEFGGATRYDAAMEAINVFAEKRKGDALGLTIFGSEVLEWTPLTKDLSALKNSTPFVRPENMPTQMGGTEIGKAIEFCNRRLSRRGDGDRLLILMSDGISSDLYAGRASEIADALKSNSIVIHAIHIGDQSPPSDLVDLVMPTGGKVFGASDRKGIAEIFSYIDQMQPTRLVPKEERRVSFYEPFAAAALFLTALHVGCLLGLRYTPW